MLFILSGEIRTYLLSDEGREVTLFRLYPGELCVLSASCVISQITFDTQMTAGMDTDVLIIPAMSLLHSRRKISMSAVFSMNWQRNGFLM